MEKELLTQSALKMYQSCPRKFDYRQQQKLIPLEQADALRFGGRFHDVIEQRNDGKDLKACIFSLEETYADRNFDESGKMINEFCHLVGMTMAYFKQYPKEQETFTFEKVEEKIESPLINPDSGHPSRSFNFGGKCDGIIIEDGVRKLYELKTSSKIDRAYIEKVSTFDTQLALYSKHLGLSECCYDVIKKPTIKRKKSIKIYDEVQEFKKDGEPKKNKTKTLKGEREETEAEYIERINDWYAIDTEDKLCRIPLTVSDGDKTRAMKTLWNVSQKILQDRREKFFFQNSGACEKWNRFCDYHALCASNDSEIIKQNQFKTKEINSELTDKKPVF